MNESEKRKDALLLKLLEELDEHEESVRNGDSRHTSDTLDLIENLKRMIRQEIQ